MSIWKHVKSEKILGRDRNQGKQQEYSEKKKTLRQAIEWRVLAEKDKTSDANEVA